MTTPSEVAPTRSDPFAHGMSELIGGPWGRHATRPRQRFWWPVRILLLVTVAACALGWAQKYYCRDPSNWVHERQYTTMCYSDVVALYYAERLDQGQLPYRDHAVEYPVLTGGVMAVAMEGARLFPPGDRPQGFFDVTAILLTLCALVLVASTVRLAGRRRPWDAMMVAVAPVLVLQAFTNWDLLAVALTGAGLWAWSRNRPGWAGAALGLGVAAKLYPLLILVLVLPPLALRSRRLGPALAALRSAAVAWLVVDLPIWLLYPASFGRFYSGNLHRLADWDSLWFGLQYAVGRQNTPWTGTAFSISVAVLLVVLVGAVLALTLAAPTRPRVAQVAFLVLLAFLLGNKVWSPQYSLWLLPLAVLARPRWGTFLLWQASEVWLLFTRFYFFVGNDKAGQGVPEWVFLWSVLARDAVLLVLAGLVVREILHPELDVVRTAEVDDPMAGPLASWA
ncbi:MAG TPA: glycosyltransferase 87 family protein [Mycobacteriales bacterium]|nr:glycosyltransferase 87 family protein [Mycobacteriales bacterium]